MNDSPITVARDPAQLAEYAADHFIDVVNASIAARGTAAVALAGGSTPRMMNGLLAAEPRRGRVDWSKVDFYFGDERCVPPDHTESNYRMTNETLFTPLAIDAARVFRMRGEDDPHVAAQAYDDLLRRTLGAPPVFDLILLGMGPDGHTASLFPGTIGSIEPGRYAVANFVPKFESYRITVTPAVLAAARRIAITAGGAEKAESLAGVLTGTLDPDRYPAQLVRPLDDVRRWLVDAAAAARLENL